MNNTCTVQSATQEIKVKKKTKKKKTIRGDKREATIDYGACREMSMIGTS